MKYNTNELKNVLYSGILSDVLDMKGYRNQAVDGNVMGLTDKTVIFGPAFTSIGTQVYSMPESPLTAQCKVVDQLSEGEVYVLSIRGEKNCAVFGELFATAVRNKGGVGVLTDGYARDLKALYEMDFPIFFVGKNPRTSKGRCEINECQIPVKFYNVTINPGDYIFGDVDGVVVVPSAIVDEVIEEALGTIRKEDEVRSRLQNGSSILKAYQEIGAI